MARHPKYSLYLAVLVLLVYLCCSCNAGKIIVVYTVSPCCFGSHVWLGAAGTGICIGRPYLHFGIGIGISVVIVTSLIQS